MGSGGDPQTDAGWPTAARAAASRLFSSASVGPVRLRHRTWVPAMVPWRAGADGEVTPEVLDWYARLAQGKPAAIVVEATGVRDVASGPLLRVSQDRFVPGLSRLADVIHKHSEGHTRAFVQLLDFLRIRRRPARERFLRAFLVLTGAHREALSPLATDDAIRDTLVGMDDQRLRAVLSPREWQDMTFGARERITDTHLPHVRDLPATLPDAFAKAAARVRDAGFEGVEIHAAHAYTLASFLSALNTRDDGYGQTPAGRVRLPLAVLAAVRAQVGSNLAVGVRFLGDEAIDGGYGGTDAAFFGVALAQGGADFLSISKGGKFEDARQPTEGQPAYPYTGESGVHCMPTLRRFGQDARGLHLPLTRQIRTAVQAAGLATPVVAAGGLHTFALAEGALIAGDCDIIAAARQSLADPDWWEKMRLGYGDQIRSCTLTNYCEGLDQKHKRVTCKLWDRTPVQAAEAALLIGLKHDGDRRLIAPRWTAKPG